MRCVPFLFEWLSSLPSRLTRRAAPAPFGLIFTSCGLSEKLCRITSELLRHSYCMASTHGDPLLRILHSPHPISGHSLRRRIIFAVQLKSDSGSRRCMSTFTCEQAKGPLLITGSTECWCKVKP